MKNGREVLYENFKNIYPGDVISKIPRITNYANDCWIRVNISYENEKDETEGLDFSCIEGMSDEWIARGEYYYYKNILKSKESVDVFKKLTIPSEWGNDHENQKMNVIVKAEAIQAENFTPDFTAMSPWGNQEIELCIHDENGVITCVKQEMNLSVEFHGGAHKLIAVPDDFFHNIKRMMPGDLYQDEISLSNTSDERIELFFRSEVSKQDADQMDLLENIQIEIGMNDKSLYKGNLLAEDMKQDISLGIIESNMSAEMWFRLYVPSYLKNDYAMRLANVTWIFSVREENGSVMQKEELHGEIDESNQMDVVKTGDESNVILWSVTGLFALVSVVISIYVRKKGDKGHEK